MNHYCQPCATCRGQHCSRALKAPLALPQCCQKMAEPADKARNDGCQGQCGTAQSGPELSGTLTKPEGRRCYTERMHMLCMCRAAHQGQQRSNMPVDRGSFTHRLASAVLRSLLSASGGAAVTAANPALKTNWVTGLSLRRTIHIVFRFKVRLIQSCHPSSNH